MKPPMVFALDIACFVCCLTLDSSWDPKWKNHGRSCACDLASRTGNRKYQESYNKCGDFQTNFTVSEVWIERRRGCKSWAYFSTELPVSWWPTLSQRTGLWNCVSVIYVPRGRFPIPFNFMSGPWIAGGLQLFLTIERRYYHLHNSPDPVRKP